jgi:hypothetical protein
VEPEDNDDEDEGDAALITLDDIDDDVEGDTDQKLKVSVIAKMQKAIPNISRTDQIGYVIAFLASLAAIYIMMATVALFDDTKAIRWFVFNLISHGVVIFLAEPIKLATVYYCGDLAIVDYILEVLHEFMVMVGMA